MANKVQRRLNRWVREHNKSLAKDAYLGLNRFHIEQVGRYHNRSYDAIYEFWLHDNKTDEIQTVWVNNYNFTRELFWKMNDFIVQIRQREGW